MTERDDLTPEDQRQAIEALGSLGYISLLAGMLKDETDDVVADAIASEDGE